MNQKLARFSFFQNYYRFSPKTSILAETLRISGSPPKKNWIFVKNSEISKTFVEKMFLCFSQNHVFPFSILVILPSTMFFRKFLLPFDRACKVAGHLVLRFLKKLFLCPKKIAYKIHLQFFGLFSRTLNCGNFFGLQNGLF